MFDEVRDLYQQVILDHGRNPKHMHRLEPFDRAAKGDNPMCGDRVEVRVRLADGRVAQAGFEARGCAISIASADLMAEAVAGQTPDEIRALSTRFRDMVRTGDCPDCKGYLLTLRPLSGVHEYPSRLKCATLPWDALLSALENDHE
jgi:nitrogen fixation protein NifU and related proteins